MAGKRDMWGHFQPRRSGGMAKYLSLMQGRRMNVAVAIRLARVVSKGAPDLLKPTQFRKGQIVRIEGWIDRPGELNSWGKPYEEWRFWQNPDIDLSVIFGEEDVAEVYVWQGRCMECRDFVNVYRCSTCGGGAEESDREAPYYCKKCKKIMELVDVEEREMEPCDRCRDEYEEELKKFRDAPWPVHYKKPEELEAGK